MSLPRVLTAGLVVGSVGHAAPLAAAFSCDPAYTNYCVPPVSEVGDLNCDYFYSLGIYNIILADPYKNPHGLDGWNYVDDGVACEGGRY